MTFQFYLREAVSDVVGGNAVAGQNATITAVQNGPRMFYEIESDFAITASFNIAVNPTTSDADQGIGFKILPADIADLIINGIAKPADFIVFYNSVGQGALGAFVDTTTDDFTLSGPQLYSGSESSPTMLAGVFNVTPEELNQPDIVVDVRQLAELSSTFSYELDFLLGPPYGTMAELIEFVTTPPYPGKISWEPGAYVLTLVVAKANGMTCNAEVWQCDALGNDIAQVGSDVQGISGPGTIQFTFAGAEITAAITDRLKVKLFGQNDTFADLIFGIMTSQSNLQTPIVQPVIVSSRPTNRERGRFLGRVPRPSEPKKDPDGFYPCGR